VRKRRPYELIVGLGIPLQVVGPISCGRPRHGAPDRKTPKDGISRSPVRKATLGSILRKSRYGVRLNEHLEHPEGENKALRITYGAAFREARDRSPGLA
jgi:hypothetical protein